MRFQFLKFVFISLITLIICSCEKSRTDNPLLNGEEYKLWYIKTSGNENPRFMYIDCYGEYYTLGYNIETGYFYHTPENNLSGKWEYNSDSSIYLNNDLFFIKIDCDTLLCEDRLTYHEGSPEPLYYNKYIKLLILYNRETDDSIVLRDTGLPIDLYEGYRSSEEKDKKHYEKWKKKITKSVLLNGRDYKLWLVKGHNQYYHIYYYYDKYGKHGLTDLSEEDWQFSNPNHDELSSTGRWYQDKDIIYQHDDDPYKIVKYNKMNDTIILLDAEQKYERILIDPHMLPKR